MLTLHVNVHPDYGTSVSVEGADPDMRDDDVQYTFEQAAQRGDKTAIKACELVGPHWIDLCGWTYQGDTRVHGKSRCYVDR